MAKMTLGEYFQRREIEVRIQLAKQDAYEKTPAGRIEKEKREARYKRQSDADETYAIENPPEEENNDD